jgi:hypothetical protein
LCGWVTPHKFSPAFLSHQVFEYPLLIYIKEFLVIQLDFICALFCQPNPPLKSLPVTRISTLNQEFLTSACMLIHLFILFYLQCLGSNPGLVHARREIYHGVIATALTLTHFTPHLNSSFLGQHSQNQLFHLFLIFFSLKWEK